jgi:phosphatidylglycerophosphate synthase
MRWLPHILTASRGFAGPLVGYILISGHHWLAFWVFIGAAFTDLFDGWLAKKLNAPEKIGDWLDPTADKCLADFTWAALWIIGWAPGWLLMLRTSFIAVFWWRARFEGFTYEPNLLGRWMISFEGTAIGVLLFHGPWLGVHWPSVGLILGTFTLCLSIGSGLQYIITPPAPTPDTVRAVDASEAECEEAASWPQSHPSTRT